MHFEIAINFFFGLVWWSGDGAGVELISSSSSNCFRILCPWMASLLRHLDPPLPSMLHTA